MGCVQTARNGNRVVAPFWTRRRVLFFFFPNRQLSDPKLTWLSPAPCTPFFFFFSSFGAAADAQQGDESVD